MTEVPPDPQPPALSLARPDLGDEERRLVAEVLDSGQLSLGPMLARFEGALAGAVGADDAIATSSGTAALHLGVRALGWSGGDEVVTTPFSFIASSNCLLFEDVKPVFADIDPVTLNLDPALAVEAVGERTVGILPVHIFGYPADLEALEQLAADRNLGVLEDACQALGAIDETGRAIGVSGNPATFAFYANKQITTAEGGAIIPADVAMAEGIRSERNQGRAVDMDWLDHDRLGFNYRLSDLHAALGVAQVSRLEELLSARARVADWYSEALADTLGGAPAGEGDPDGLVLPANSRGQARRSWFVYTVRLPKGVDRDAVIRDLAAAGVPAKGYLPCIHLMPFYRERFGYKPGDFPVAEDVAVRSLALPFHTALSEADVARAVAALAALDAVRDRA